ncbi:MAG: PQQ-dependent sugar dehydrogenase [Bacteroidetes bacterium]|nr:PQQ-dependent sugar dehydrogenase [Bacteroidota bacterium]
MKQFLLIIGALILSTSLMAQIQLRETTIDTATLITGLDIPWEIQWGPDDHIWTTERYGRISRINPETGIQHVILDISDQVFQEGESGLLGMVLHPDFDMHPYVFTAYTYMVSGNIKEKIVRYEYDNGQLADEFVLLDNIQGNTTHDGCRMIILPDQTLLFSTGDAQNQPAAQNLEHLSGKFLRLNLDGSIPDDNPFPDNPVYSFGHRNAQGLYLAPNGIIYSSEHGPSTDDELNIIEPGRNYGWPEVHGFCDLPDEITFCDENNVKEPLEAWTPTIATSDIVYYNHEAIPEWQGHILLTSLKNKRLYVMTLNEDGTEVVGEEQLFTNWWGRLRDICIGPSGEIYLATNGPSWSNTEPFTHSIVKLWNPDYVGIENTETDKAGGVKLFPNPATVSFHVEVVPQMIGRQMKIYSMEGKLMIDQTIDSLSTTVNTQKLSSGVFLFQVVSGQKTVYSEKLFINKE